MYSYLVSILDYYQDRQERKKKVGFSPDQPGIIILIAPETRHLFSIMTLILC